MGEGRRNAGRTANLNKRTKLSKWKRKRKAGGGVGLYFSNGQQS